MTEIYVVVDKDGQHISWWYRRTLEGAEERRLAADATHPEDGPHTVQKYRKVGTCEWVREGHDSPWWITGCGIPTKDNPDAHNNRYCFSCGDEVVRK